MWLAFSGSQYAAVETVAESAVRQLPKEIRELASSKEAQVRRFARTLGVTISPQIWEFFEEARQGDHRKASALFADLRTKAGIYEGFDKAYPSVATPAWHAVLETDLAIKAYVGCGPRYSRAIARDIIGSIQPKSVYFGGAEPGRGLVTAFCRSHERGEPFFTISQNHLVDGWYLDYLQEMCRGSVWNPGLDDRTRAFAEYFKDVEARLSRNALRPGEMAHMVDDKLQVQGEVAVMAVNALLVRRMIDYNPARGFFVEESHALEWMYPHLVPNGLILKLEREPLMKIPVEAIDKDRDYWNVRIRSAVGDWLRPETSVRAVCGFTTTAFVERDLSKFKGDAEFICNPYVCRTYSKCRSAIGEVYAWRARQATDDGERSRMQGAADFAFRQALAIDPANIEILQRFGKLLFEQQKYSEALLIMRNASQVDPENAWLKDRISELESQTDKPQPGW